MWAPALLGFALAAAAAAQTLTVVSSARYDAPVARDSIASAFGQNLAPRTDSSSLPVASLAGVSVRIADSRGVEHSALIYYASPTLINFVVPAAAAPGAARVTVGASSGTVQIDDVAPGLYSALGDGRGVAAAVAVRATPGGSQARLFVFQCAAGACGAVPVDLGAASDIVALELYGTGIRNRREISATIGGVPADVLFSGPQTLPGLDQINLLVPRSLAGRAAAEIVLTVDGRRANPLTVSFAAAVGAPVTLRFDPAQPLVGPFPANSLTVADPAQSTGLRVNLPLPDCNADAAGCLEARLVNELDGFSPRPRLSARFSGPVDTDSLKAGLALVWLERGIQPALTAMPLNHLVYDSATDTAAGKPDGPLDQQRRFLFVVTDAVRDRAGNPVGADPAYTACVTSPANPYCTQLAEAVRAAAPALGTRRIVGASLFTTLSTTSWLERARRALANTPPAFQRTHSFEAAGILAITARLQNGVNPVRYEEIALPLLNVILNGIGRVVFGNLQSPSYLNADQLIPAVPTGAALPAPARVETIGFNAYLPSSAKPAGGYPVVIFGHGLNDSRLGGPTLVAGSFARAGLATIAINAVGHGSGPESRIVVQQASGATDVPTPGRGRDLDNDGQIGSREGCLILGPTPAGLRDCIRQTAVDLMQLVRLIRSGIDLDGDGTVDLNPERVFYTGQSLGGIYGTALMAVEPDLPVAVLNVAGGSIVDASRWSEQFSDGAADVVRALRPALLPPGVPFRDNYPLRDQPVRILDARDALVQGILERLEWWQMPGDPIAFAPHLRLAPLPGVPAKRTLFQIAFGDRTVPNPANSALIRHAGGRESTSLYRHDRVRERAADAPADPHPFLVDVRSVAVAGAAQDQAAAYLLNGGAQVPNPDNIILRFLLGTGIFELAPAQLPEALNY